MIYKLNINHDPKMRGVKGSQIQPDQNNYGMEMLYDFFIYKNNFYSNIGAEIPFDFILESIIKKGAKLTDVLHQGHINASIGLVVSKKFRDFISGYSLIPCEWYELKIKDSKSEYIEEEYYWMYPHRLVEVIDFELTSKESKSIIEYSNEEGFVNLRYQSKSLIDQIEQKYPFNSPEKFVKIQTIQQSIAPRKIFLKEKNIEKKYDFFGFKYDVNWYISEKLKNDFETIRLSGFEIGELTLNDVIEFA